jgi:type IV pilus assembly protein PilM
MSNILLYNLLGKKPKGFGLEIEDDSIKAVLLKKNKKGFIVPSCGVKNLKKGLVQDGQVIDPQGLAGEIKELLRITRPKQIKSKFVVFSVPETKAFIRTIQIPKMSRAEAKEAIKWETEANIPVSSERVYLDWQIIGSKEKNDEVLVVAVPKEIIDSYCEAISLAGLIPLAVEIDMIATIRSLTSEESNKNPLLVIDIGADKTSISICKNQIPYFTSSIPLSGRTFTDALQKGLGVSWEKAEELKAKFGLGKMQKDDMLYNIFNPLIENLTMEIERSISFYSESISSEEKVERIILSGGGALLRELADYLSERLKINVALGNPVINFGLKGDLPDKIQRELAPYATSVGLALRSYNYED